MCVPRPKEGPLLVCVCVCQGGAAAGVTIITAVVGYQKQATYFLQIHKCLLKNSFHNSCTPHVCVHYIISVSYGYGFVNSRVVPYICYERGFAPRCLLLRIGVLTRTPADY